MKRTTKRSSSSSEHDVVRLHVERTLRDDGAQVLPSPEKWFGDQPTSGPVPEQTQCCVCASEACTGSRTYRKLSVEVCGSCKSRACRSCVVEGLRAAAGSACPCVLCACTSPAFSSEHVLREAQRLAMVPANAGVFEAPEAAFSSSDMLRAVVAYEKDVAAAAAVKQACGSPKITVSDVASATIASGVNPWFMLAACVTKCARCPGCPSTAPMKALTTTACFEAKCDECGTSFCAFCWKVPEPGECLVDHLNTCFCNPTYGCHGAFEDDDDDDDVYSHEPFLTALLANRAARDAGLLAACTQTEHELPESLAEYFREHFHVDILKISSGDVWVHYELFKLIGDTVFFVPYHAYCNDFDTRLLLALGSF